MITSKEIVIAIDPGKQGGFAAFNNRSKELLEAHKMPETEPEIAELFRNFYKRFGKKLFFVMEKVGFHKKGNAAQTSVSFGTHCGYLRACIEMMKCPLIEIRAQPWMKGFLGRKPPSGDSYAQKKKRKNTIKEHALKLYPDGYIILNTADAVGIGHYFIHSK